MHVSRKTQWRARSSTWRVRRRSTPSAHKHPFPTLASLPQRGALLTPPCSSCTRLPQAPAGACFFKGFPCQSRARTLRVVDCWFQKTAAPPLESLWQPETAVWSGGGADFHTPRLCAAVCLAPRIHRLSNPVAIQAASAASVSSSPRNSLSLPPSPALSPL